MNKKLSLLAAAILSHGVHAGFDQGNAILFAYNYNTDDTYFVDLGVSGQDLVNAVSINITDSGLASFLSANAGAQWTVIASANDTASVGGPPAPFSPSSYINSGVVSSSATGSAVGTNGATNDQQRHIMNAWLSDIQAASGGATSFGVNGSNQVSSNAGLNSAFFSDSLIFLNSQSPIFYSQANPEDGALLSDANIVSQIGNAGYANLSENSASLISSASTSFESNTAFPYSCFLGETGSIRCGGNESFDSDFDGVSNESDNCLLNYNPDQLNFDGDELGDICDSDDDNDGQADLNELECGSEPLNAASMSIDSDNDSLPDCADNTPNGDIDNDGVDNLSDNCPSLINADQSDIDNDLLGDVCDEDIDGDGVANDADAFPLNPNEAIDSDEDGIGENNDNCPNVVNTDQSDIDNDLLGDVCDEDIDGDGVANSADALPLNPNETIDTDGDGEGNNSDTDDDNDSVDDNSDAFPLDNLEAFDKDDDGVGDNADNCPNNSNENQSDFDTDGIGDICDETPNGDYDNDGIDELADNCPIVYNPFQTDSDNDGLGDLCDADPGNVRAGVFKTELKFDSDSVTCSDWVESNNGDPALGESIYCDDAAGIRWSGSFYIAATSSNEIVAIELESWAYAFSPGYIILAEEYLITGSYDRLSRSANLSGNVPFSSTREGSTSYINENISINFSVDSRGVVTGEFTVLTEETWNLNDASYTAEYAGTVSGMMSSVSKSDADLFAADGSYLVYKQSALVKREYCEEDNLISREDYSVSPSRMVTLGDDYSCESFNIEKEKKIDETYRFYHFIDPNTGAVFSREAQGVGDHWQHSWSDHSGIIDSAQGVMKLAIDSSLYEWSDEYYINGEKTDIVITDKLLNSMAMDFSYYPSLKMTYQSIQEQTWSYSNAVWTMNQFYTLTGSIIPLGHTLDFGELLSDVDDDNVGDVVDNCILLPNFDQSDLDSDGKGDGCDSNKDGDDWPDEIEIELGADPNNPDDSYLVTSFYVDLARREAAFQLDREVDTDSDGISDALEVVLGGDPNDAEDSGLISQLTNYIIDRIGKNVPAMSGIGLLALGISMLCLGVVRMRNKK